MHFLIRKINTKWFNFLKKQVEREARCISFDLYFIFSRVNSIHPPDVELGKEEPQKLYTSCYYVIMNTKHFNKKSL